MSSRIWLVNIVLAAAVLFFGIKAYGLWSKGKKWPSEIRSVKKPLPWQEKKIAKKTFPPESDYEVIVNNNLFRDARAEAKPQEPKKRAETKSKAQGKTLTILEKAAKLTNLYGVIIVGEHREALIGEIPAGRGLRGGEKGVKRAVVGDIVGRFKVKEIRETSVLLSAGGREFRVSLFDIDKPKKRGRAKKKTGPVVIGVKSKAKTLLAKGTAKGKERPPEPVASKRKTLSKTREKKRNPSAPDRSRPERR